MSRRWPRKLRLPIAPAPEAPAEAARAAGSRLPCEVRPSRWRTPSPRAVVRAHPPEPRPPREAIGRRAADSNAPRAAEPELIEVWRPGRPEGQRRPPRPPREAPAAPRAAPSAPRAASCRRRQWRAGARRRRAAAPVAGAAAAEGAPAPRRRRTDAMAASRARPRWRARASAAIVPNASARPPRPERPDRPQTRRARRRAGRDRGDRPTARRPPATVPIAIPNCARNTSRAATRPRRPARDNGSPIRIRRSPSSRRCKAQLEANKEASS